MVLNPRSYLILILAICLASCAPDVITTPTNAGSPSLTFISPTFTSTPTETSTPTLPPTLTPLQANEKIRAYMQEVVDCPAPCFWGIAPGQTQFAEATNIFSFLGLQLEQTNARDNQKFYAANYHPEEGLEISIILTVQDSIIKALDVGMNIPSETGVSRKWSAYSPETLTRRYGAPSRVEFSLGRAAPNPSHSMILYFENVDMIILYLGQWDGFLKNSDTLELCPLTNEVDFIKIWMGNEPRYPPPPNVPLEEATSLTIEEFSKLLTGDPDKACFSLKDEAFP